MERRLLTNGDPSATGRLRRLVLVRPGRTVVDRDRILVGSLDPEISADGRAQMRELTRHWEWVEGLVVSPMRRATASARLLAPDAPLAIDQRLRPRQLGRLEGRAFEELEGLEADAALAWRSRGAGVELPFAERSAAFDARVAEALEDLLRTPRASLCVVAHFGVIRRIAALLLRDEDEDVLPEGRPYVGEMALLVRQAGTWRLGRRSSDPEPLRSPLEREGLSGRRPPLSERHVAHLEVRAGRAPPPRPAPPSEWRTPA